MIFSNIQVRVKRAGPSGLGDLEVTEYIARIRSGPFEREDCAPVHLVTTEARFMSDQQLPSLFYCTSHMMTVFITSNQIPLHVHAVFALILSCTLYTSGARHDAHAYS